MSQQLAVRAQDIAPPKRADAIQVMDPIPVLDTARFEHMQRIALVMAKGNLIPETLCTTGTKDNKELLSEQTIMANCFLIVNQAVRWGMDPFAVVQCVSVVHGKLCYEGKLVAAVIEAKLGIRLRYEWNDKTGDAMGITVSGRYPGDDDDLSIRGTVGEWKTTGQNSPWSKMAKRMLAYRGAREWARLYAPGVLLGVCTDDEMQDMGRMAHLRDVTPPPVPIAPPAPIHVPLAGRARKEEKPKAEPAKAEGGELPLSPPPAELRPIDDYPKTLRDWSDSFAMAETLDDLESFWTDEVLPYVEAGLVHAPDVEDLEHAFSAAKAKL